MFKYLKIRKFRKQIVDICSKNSYELVGDIKRCKISQNTWTFAVKTKNKNFLVKLIVPFGYFNTYIQVNSSRFISAVASLFSMRGLFGVIDIPIKKEFHFNLPDNSFNLNMDITEKIFLVFPKCTHLYVFENDKPYHLSTFRVGIKVDDISIHDGASFRYMLENPDDVRKFAGFGE